MLRVFSIGCHAGVIKEQHVIPLSWTVMETYFIIFSVFLIKSAGFVMEQ